MLLLDFGVQSATGLLRMPLELTMSCVIVWSQHFNTADEFFPLGTQTRPSSAEFLLGGAGQLT